MAMNVENLRLVNLMAMLCILLMVQKEVLVLLSHLIEAQALRLPLALKALVSPPTKTDTKESCSKEALE